MGYSVRTPPDQAQYIHPLAWEILKTRRRILDIGCEIGRLSPVFPDSVLIGVDVRENCRICLERGYSEFYECDVEVDHLPKLNADGVVISHILEHVLHPHIALEHVLSTLVQGAYVYITGPTLDNAAYWDDYTHIWPFTEASVVRLMEDAGLKRIQLLHRIKAPFRGVGRSLHLVTKKDPHKAHPLALKYPFLPAKANIYATGYVYILGF